VVNGLLFGQVEHQDREQGVLLLQESSRPTGGLPPPKKSVPMDYCYQILHI